MRNQDFGQTLCVVEFYEVLAESDIVLDFDWLESTNTKVTDPDAARYRSQHPVAGTFGLVRRKCSQQPGAPHRWDEGSRANLSEHRLDYLLLASAERALQSLRQHAEPVEKIGQGQQRRNKDDDETDHERQKGRDPERRGFHSTPGSLAGSPDIWGRAAPGIGSTTAEPPVAGPVEYPCLEGDIATSLTQEADERC